MVTMNAAWMSVVRAITNEQHQKIVGWIRTAGGNVACAVVRVEGLHSMCLVRLVDGKPSVRPVPYHRVQLANETAEMISEAADRADRQTKIWWGEL